MSYKKKAKFPSPFLRVVCLEQFQYRLSSLRSQTKRVNSQLLSGLQSQHISGLFVHISQGQFVGAFFQNINHIFGKGFAALNNGVVVTKFGRHRAQSINCGFNLRNCRFNILIGFPIICCRTDFKSGRRSIFTFNQQVIR